jgi:hypothetical protein
VRSYCLNRLRMNVVLFSPCNIFTITIYNIIITNYVARYQDHILLLKMSMGTRLNFDTGFEKFCSALIFLERIGPSIVRAMNGVRMHLWIVSPLNETTALYPKRHLILAAVRTWNLTRPYVCLSVCLSVGVLVGTRKHTWPWVTDGTLLQHWNRDHCWFKSLNDIGWHCCIC